MTWTFKRGSSGGPQKLSEGWNTSAAKKSLREFTLEKKKAPGEPPFYISLFKEEFLRNIERKFLLEFVVTRQGVMFYTES